LSVPNQTTGDPILDDTLRDLQQNRNTSRPVIAEIFADQSKRIQERIRKASDSERHSQTGEPANLVGI